MCTHTHAYRTYCRGNNLKQKDCTGLVHHPLTGILRCQFNERSRHALYQFMISNFLFLLAVVTTNHSHYNNQRHVYLPVSIIVSWCKNGHKLWREVLRGSWVQYIQEDTAPMDIASYLFQAFNHFLSSGVCGMLPAPHAVWFLHSAMPS